MSYPAKCDTCNDAGTVPVSRSPVAGSADRTCPECQGRKVVHANLGVCVVSEECLRLQSTNPDRTSMFVWHDGEIKEVTASLVTQAEPEPVRS